MISRSQLLSFCRIVETRHFTEAARSLGITQSAISQHVRKLEQSTGRTLLLRDTHRVVPTADGEALHDLAAEILGGYARLDHWVARTEKRTRLRFGAGEDLVRHHLPELLREFRDSNPALDVDLTVGLSEALTDRLDAGQLDVVFAKRPPGDTRGHPVWEERPVWLAAPGFSAEPGAPVPLVAYDDHRSITRATAIAALDAAGRPWQLACTSSNLGGLLAGVSAGFGVTLQWPHLRGSGLVDAPAAMGLPAPAPIRYAVYGRARRLAGPAAALLALILERMVPAGPPLPAEGEAGDGAQAA